MKSIFETYIYAYLKWKSTRKENKLISYYKKSGVAIEENGHIYSSLCTPEPCLIIIGYNVTISTEVRFLTHDNSVCKVLLDVSDVSGRFSICNNCFIGARVVVLLGVSIDENSVVAGSIVTKSFSGNSIIGDNSAKNNI